MPPVGPKPNLTSEQINSTTHDYVREWDESTTSWNIIETPKQPALTSEQKNSTTHDYLYEWNESTTSWDLKETPKEPALTSEQQAAGQYYTYNSDNNSWELQTP